MGYYEGGESKACARIEKAREQVAQVQMKYQRGKASLDAVNQANAGLANAVYRSYEFHAGVVPDDR